MIAREPDDRLRAIMLQYYTSALVFSLLAIAAGFVLGGVRAACIVTLLGLLETSMSFDNAVINARILGNWNELWRRRFLVWGMPVSVLGVRLVAPLIIVAVVAGIGPLEVLRLAIQDPQSYAYTLASVHAQIAAFGGAFLSMVFLDFALDVERDIHWLAWLERPLQKLGRLRSVPSAVTLIAVAWVSKGLPADAQGPFVVAGLWGFIIYILAHSIAGVSGKLVRQGLQGLLYLELLDATFSLDGVIGSFVLSKDIFIIALGLGIGALFVRSMTLHLVATGALQEFPFLEHGAYWTIGALTVILFASSILPVSEVLSGSIGAVLIGLSFWSSLNVRRRTTAHDHPQ